MINIIIYHISFSKIKNAKQETSIAVKEIQKKLVCLKNRLNTNYQKSYLAYLDDFLIDLYMHYYTYTDMHFLQLNYTIGCYYVDYKQMRHGLPNGTYELQASIQLSDGYRREVAASRS